MSDSATNLDTISASQAQKEVTLNALMDAASPATVYGRHASQCGGLVWAYYGGSTSVAGVPTEIGNDTLTLTASSTCYVRRDDTDGTVDFVTSAPSGWPATDGDFSALYEIVTGASQVTSWLDWRTSGLGGSGGGAGSQGAQGAQGAQGSQGSQGSQGNQGNQGNQGSQGSQGAGGSIGGSTTQIQYNSGGSLAGDSRLTFDATNKVALGQFSSDSGAINAQTGTTYTLQASDNGKVITLSNASAIAVTVPASLGAGFSCMCIQIGAGQVSFTASSTTINPSSTLKLVGQYAACTLYAYVSNVFLIAGNISA